MTQLTLAASNPTPSPTPSHQWAHDIRNTLATIGLHLETLQKLSGPAGGKAASAALALVHRGAGMCTDALSDALMPRAASRRRAFDLSKTVIEVVAALAPTAPDGFEFAFDSGEAHIALGNQSDVFRIIFNIVQNAVNAARRNARISQVTMAIERKALGVGVRISDNGPGLPKAVKAKLFRAPSESCAASGFGLAIARELAERNGGALSFVDGTEGATFLLELPQAAGREIISGAAMPSLGRRVAG